MDVTRRALLGAAALGAGGLALMQTAAAAEGSDHGKPGEGGYARNAVQLPPGAKVAYHDPKDIEAMPNFKYSLDGNDPKITSGGWAKESTVHQLPVSKGIAGVHMFLNPGASRELHWHAIAAEWAFVIDGRCQTVVIEPSGASEINNYEPGDLWYFAKGHGHSIQCIGDKPCHFILSFDNGAFSEHGTFSITDWVNVTPKDMVAANFNLPTDFFDVFPKGETYIQSGPILPISQALDAPWPRESTHKFRLLKDQKAVRDFEGGTFRLASVDEFPASRTMSGGLMVIKSGSSAICIGTPTRTNGITTCAAGGRWRCSDRAGAARSSTSIRAMRSTSPRVSGTRSGIRGTRTSRSCRRGTTASSRKSTSTNGCGRARTICWRTISPGCRIPQSAR